MNEDYYDNDIRKILKKHFKFLNYEEIDELKITKTRIDLAFLNTTKLIGVEIKSNRDSLTRLPLQLKEALEIFDEVWVCLGDKHITTPILNNLPLSVGIFRINEIDKVKVVREATINQGNKEKISFMLFKEELFDFLAIRNNYKKIKSKNRKELASLLARDFSLEKVKEVVRAYYLGRLTVGWKRDFGKKSKKYKLINLEESVKNTNL